MWKRNPRRYFKCPDTNKLDRAESVSINDKMEGSVILYPKGMFGLHEMSLKCLGLAIATMTTAHFTNAFIAYLSAVSPAVTFFFYM